MRKTGEKNVWWHSRRVQASDAAALARLPQWDTTAARLRIAAGSVVSSLPAMAQEQCEEAAVEACCRQIEEAVRAEPHPEFARAFLHALLFCSLEPLAPSLAGGGCIDTLAAASLWRLPVGLYSALALRLSYEDLLVDCLCCFASDLDDSGSCLAAEIFGAVPELALQTLPRLLAPPSEWRMLPAPPEAVMDTAVAAMSQALSTCDVPLGPAALASVHALATGLSEALETAGGAASPLHTEALSDVLSGPAGQALASDGSTAPSLLRLQAAVGQSVQSDLSPGGLGASALGFGARCHLRTRLMLLLGPEGQDGPGADRARPGDGPEVPLRPQSHGDGDRQTSWQRLLGSRPGCGAPATAATGQRAGQLLAGGAEGVRLLAVAAARCLPGMPPPTKLPQVLPAPSTPLSPAAGAVSLALTLQEVCRGLPESAGASGLLGLVTSTLSEVQIPEEQAAVAEALLLHPAFEVLRRQLEGSRFAREALLVRKQLIKVSNRMSGEAQLSPATDAAMLSRLFGDPTAGGGGSTADTEAVIQLALPHCVLFPALALERFVADSLTHPGQQPAVLTVLSRLWPLGQAEGGCLLASVLRRQLQAVDPGQAHKPFISGFVSALMSAPPHQPLLSREVALHGVGLPMLMEALTVTEDTLRALLTSVGCSVVTAAASPQGSHLGEQPVDQLSTSTLLNREGPGRLFKALLQLADSARGSEASRVAAERLLRSAAKTLVASAQADGGKQSQLAACREVQALSTAARASAWRLRLLLREALLLPPTPPPAEGRACPADLPSRLAGASLWPEGLGPSATRQDTARDLFTLWAVCPEAGRLHPEDGHPEAGEDPASFICSALTSRLLTSSPSELRRCLLAEVCRSLPGLPAGQVGVVLSTALPRLLTQALADASESGGSTEPAARDDQGVGRALSLEIVGRAVVVSAGMGPRGEMSSRRLLQHFCGLCKALSLRPGAEGELLAARGLREAVAVYGQVHRHLDCSALEVLLLQLIDRLMLCEVSTGAGTDPAEGQPGVAGRSCLVESLAESYGSVVDWVRQQVATVPEAARSKIDFAVGKMEADRLRGLAATC